MTVISVNQTESEMLCSELHYKAESTLNIFILVIVALVMVLGIYELRQLKLAGKEFLKKLIGNVFDEGNNIFDMENLLSGENNASGET